MQTKQVNQIISTEDQYEMSACCEQVYPLIWERDGIYKVFSAGMILNAIEMAKTVSSDTIKLLWKDGIRMSPDIAKLILGD